MHKKLEHRYNAIIRDRIHPFLKSKAFKRNGTMFLRNRHDLSDVIWFSRSRWNTEEQLEFTIDIGIYIPQISSLYFPQRLENPRKPNSGDWSLSTRIGALLPERKDIWWKLDVEDDETSDENISVEIIKLMSNQGIPFLESFHRSLDVADFLIDPPKDLSHCDMRSRSQHLYFAALIYICAGEKKEGKILLDRAVAEDIAAALKLEKTRPSVAESIRDKAEKLESRISQEFDLDR